MIVHLPQRCTLNLGNSIKSSGITLLELLIALSVFAVIAIVAYSGLETVLTTRLYTEQLSENLMRLQMAFTWLERDIEQYVDRPIRDEYGDTQPALHGKMSQLELTRSGWRNPAQQQRSTLQRVSYQIENNRLSRSYWWVLDRSQDSKPIKTELLTHVNQIKFRFLGDTLQWYEQWPPLQQLSSDIPITLKAVEVDLTVEGWGQLIRLFRVVEQPVLTKQE